MSYDGSLLDHLAEYLIYLSSSSSFWFSLNSSYDHDFHLSKRLGITSKDYEFLLVAADLAHIDKRWGFSIKMMKWRLFLEGHRFTTINCDGTFEVDVKKVDLNAFIQGESAKHRERVYFIRIGVLERPPPPPPLHAVFTVHRRHRHRHLRCRTLHPRALTKSHHRRFCHRRHRQPHCHCPCHCRDVVVLPPP